MKVERIDHVHIKVNDLKRNTSAIEGLLGEKFLYEGDFTSDFGMHISYNPFPLGFELMKVSDENKEMGRIYSAEPDGVFALSLKVPNIDKATVEMESMGLKLLMRYDFGDIKEALFDTKRVCSVYIELIEYATEDITEADHGDVGSAGSIEFKKKIEK